MDSLTHVALGAVVGTAVLGRGGPADAGSLSMWAFLSHGERPDPVGVYQHAVEPGFAHTIETRPGNGKFIPYAVFDASGKQGVYVGIEWSYCRISAAMPDTDAPATLRVRGGEFPSFTSQLAPGETFDVPPCFVGAYKGDVDDAGNRLRRHLFAHSMPQIVRKDASYPKVQWNAFGATGDKPGSWNCVETKYYLLIDQIAPLGFEDVMIDVGWWEGGHGLGAEPKSDPVDWPSGMAKAADYAHKAGLRFLPRHRQPAARHRPLPHALRRGGRAGAQARGGAGPGLGDGQHQVRRPGAGAPRRRRAAARRDGARSVGAGPDRRLDPRGRGGDRLPGLPGAARGAPPAPPGGGAALRGAGRPHPLAGRRGGPLGPAAVGRPGRRERPGDGARHHRGAGGRLPAGDAGLRGRQLRSRGGQNILEPAGQGRPVLFGPHMENFKDSVQVLQGRGGIQVATPEQLRKVAGELLSRPERLAEPGATGPRGGAGRARGERPQRGAHAALLPRGRAAA